MRLVYDFDATLFSTADLWNAWVDTLAQYESDRDLIEDVGEELFEVGFTLEEHAVELGLEKDICDELVKKFHAHTDEEGESLVFNDVVPFLEEQQKHHEQIILTYGNEEYQYRKIQASGLHAYVDEIKIAGPDDMKHVQLQDMFEQSAETIIFIDDSPRQLSKVQETGLPIQLIRMLREGERHTDESHPCDDQMWDCVSSLEELEDYLMATP